MVAVINGLQQGYYCDSCKSYMDILTNSCKICKTHRPVNLNDIASTVRLERLGFDLAKDKIELYSKFFNQKKIEVAAMDLLQLEAHFAELAEIALMARAFINATDEIIREKKARLSPQGKEWLLSNDTSLNPNVTDSLNQVKERKARMSKADKLLEAMKSLGIENSEEWVQQNVVKKATEQQVSSINFNGNNKSKNKVTLSECCRMESHEACPGRFTIAATGKSNACDCECHKVKVTEQFDLSILS